MKRWGYYNGAIDGIYGTGTLNAVRWFQSKNGLTVDGIAGPKTLAAMGIGGFTKMLKAAVARSPLNRNVSLEDVGKAGLFLASDLSSGVTGEVIYADCGCHSAYASTQEMDILSNNLEI